VEQVDDWKFFVGQDVRRNYDSILHIAVERGRVKHHINHFYARREAGKVRRQWLLMSAARKNADAKEEDDCAACVPCSELTISFCLQAGLYS
jgi:hypothetical protein